MAAGVLALSACGSNSGSSGSSGGGGSVKLAFMGPLTGPNAQLGINIRNGAKLALSEHNSQSGVTQVTLDEQDTQGDPNQAIALSKKVVDNKDVAVIGPTFSGESKTADPVFEEGKIPSVTGSATSPTLSGNGWKYWHRIVANDDVQGPGIGSFIVKTVGAKKVAIIDDQSEYGKDFAKAVNGEVAKDGAQVVTDSIDPNGSDYTSTVNKIKAAGSDAVFFGGYYSNAGKLAKQLRDAGSQAKFFSGDGSLDQNLIKIGGAAVNGAFMSCTCQLATTASDNANVKKFAESYKSANGVEPGTYSAEGYDIAKILLAAIDAGNKTPDAINTYLKTVNYDGVSKPIKFDDKGDLAGGTAYIHEVVGGQIYALGDYKTAKPKS